MRQSNQGHKVRLSTIYTRYFDKYLDNPKYPVTPEIFKAVNKTIACRTARIGVNIYECPECQHTKYVLRSCKNRFCPRCGYSDTKKWADQMLHKIAPCPHHHIVFTLPASLRGVSLRNKDKVHSLLLKSSSETMIDWFGAKYNLLPGIMNVLHTAGSDQKYHPHAHMLISAGGIDAEHKLQRVKDSWYLINQKFLAGKFRWHFEKGLFKLFKAGELDTEFGNLIVFKSFIKQVNKQDWVVSVQAPLKKADDIVNYVGRYSKRACISEYNIVSADDGVISFRHKNYKQVDHRGKPELTITELPYRDFLGRLFQHVPSKGYRVVRYYGMYCNRLINSLEFNLDREERKGLGTEDKGNWRSLQIEKTGMDPLICPCCKKEMVMISEYYDHRTRWVRESNQDLVASELKKELWS